MQTIEEKLKELYVMPQGEAMSTSLWLFLNHPNLVDAPKSSDRNRTPLHIAAKHGHADVVEKLIELGSKVIDTPDNYGWTPLHAAAVNGHMSAIEALVRLESNAIDTPDNPGWTPLYAAAWYGHVSAIATLVRLGSNAIDTTNNLGGFTPLFAAASNGHVSAIETLVQLGSNAIDTPNNNGNTPLNAAAMNGHVSVIELLVRLGSNAINNPDRDDWNPMHAAALTGKISVIEVLFRLGCKYIVTASYWPPVDTAAVLNRVDCVRLFKALGFDLTTSFKERCPGVEPTEDETAEMRYGVYFGHSLVHRLLFELDRLCNTKAVVVQRRTQ